jgi:membrane protein
MIARLRAAGVGWAEDQASQMGAALAYYTLFSLTPLLILAMAVLGMLMDQEQSRAYVLDHIRELHPDSAETVAVMLDGFQSAKGGAGVSLVGVASLLFGATGMFNSLRTSLSRVWRLKGDKDGLVTGFVKSYLIALLMVLVSCTFVVVLLLASTAMPLLERLWKDHVSNVPWSERVALHAASLLCMTLLFLFTYRFMSDGRLPYRRLWFGALVTAVLFSLGKVAITQYLWYIGLRSAYGAAGSVVVFLAWVYYSAQILFFGAEVIRAGLPPAKAGPMPT